MILWSFVGYEQVCDAVVGIAVIIFLSPSLTPFCVPLCCRYRDNSMLTTMNYRQIKTLFCCIKSPRGDSTIVAVVASVAVVVVVAAVVQMLAKEQGELT